MIKSIGKMVKITTLKMAEPSPALYARNENHPIQNQVNGNAFRLGLMIFLFEYVVKDPPRYSEDHHHTPS